jgi:glutamate dehydrogenase (NADP+)
MYQLDRFLTDVSARNPAQPEFVQAVEEVSASIIDLVNENPAYASAKILDRLTEPDRVVIFKVEWEDDAGELHVNRGYRVQFNNVLGPYKGGISFHPSVTRGGRKFLASEQIFKNGVQQGGWVVPVQSGDHSAPQLLRLVGRHVRRCRLEMLRELRRGNQ